MQGLIDPHQYVSAAQGLFCRIAEMGVSRSVRDPYGAAFQSEPERHNVEDPQCRPGEVHRHPRKGRANRSHAFLGNVAEGDLDGPQPVRGEHNPTAQLGFEQLPPEASQAAALRQAIVTLSAAARSELYAMARIGQGHLAAKKWHRGLTEAKTLGDEAVTAALLDDPDLHDHLIKGLYELKL